jgi:DNA repair exonuclease SbcCD ATPase subunit
MTIHLESLAVKAFRGVRDKKTFDFGGRNTVVLGPNGSGKSTVLQAIEFLLTGKVSALRGSGTGGIRTKEHVPNQYADPAEMFVEATFSTGDANQFRVTREFSDRDRLKAEQRPAELRELLNAANQGLLHLSREELLELVITTPGDRKDQIYHLMNTEEIDKRRRQLKRVAKKAKKRAEKGETLHDEHANRLSAILGDDSIDDEGPQVGEEMLRRAVSVRRKQLGGEPLDELSVESSFTAGLASPSEQASHPLQRADVTTHLDSVAEWFDETEGEFEEALSELQSEIRVIRADQELLKSLSERSLLEQGKELIGPDTDACPLCKTPWDAAQLETQLENRAQRLERIDERTQRIEEISGRTNRTVQPVIGHLTGLLEVLSHETIEVDITALEVYRDGLETISTALDEEISSGPTAVDVDVFRVHSNDSDTAEVALTRLIDTARELPEQDQIERAWSELQSLDDAYSGLVSAKEQQEQYEQSARELEAAHEMFIETRDDVLGETFETVSHRFAMFYEAINPDESSFDPKIGQTKTGIDFTVDFYETGEHPPNALHSEGHQDLMGVCLFLALVAELSPLERTPVLLDDIVMSVDGDHREQFASVLAMQLDEYFQFIISSHDDAWAQQLIETGVVEGEDVIQFTDWTPEGGPLIEGEFTIL